MSGPRRTGVLLGAVVIGLSSALGILVGPYSIVPAIAAATGTVSGTITQVGGGAASDVCAQVFAAANTSQPVASACSDATGSYVVPALAPGRYVVFFVDGDTLRHDLPQWYDVQALVANANVILVQGGVVTGGIDAAMTPGGWITGTVTDASTHSPIPGACVHLYNSSGQSVTGVYVNGNQQLDVCTDASGHYATGGLAAGTYSVAFNTSTGGGVIDPAHTSQWYANQSSQATATPVTVTATQPTSGVDAALQAGTAPETVSGSVTDANGPVAGASVSVSDSSGPLATVATAPDGTYTATLYPGSYQLQFIPPAGSPDQAQWYDNAANQAGDTPVTVSATPVTGVDAVLADGGSIDGTVTDGAGTGIPGIEVRACSVSTGTCTTGWTGTNGRYSLLGLGTDSYAVTFQGEVAGIDATTHAAADTSAYVDQVYPDLIAGSAPGTDVAVTAGQTTPGIDDTALVGSTFSGTVTDVSTGMPLQNICVQAAPTAVSGYRSTPACTDSNGHYTTSGVPAGSYQLDFTNNAGRYLEQWYDNQSSQTLGTVLTAVPPTDMTGLDAAMQIGGFISGTVTDASSGAGVEDLCVELYPVGAPSATAGLLGGCTDASGTYTSPPLPAGTYDVEFVDFEGNYETQYYRGTSLLSSATPVTVVDGQTIPGIDAAVVSETVAGPPTGVKATGADGAATVTFTPPTSDGGQPVVDYVIAPSPPCPSCTGLNPLGTSSVVSGLTNGVPYTFTVEAINEIGNSQPSAPSNAVTPGPPPPPPDVCRGTSAHPGVLAGTYRGDTTVTGFCVVDGGSARIDGDLTVTPGSELDATSAGNGTGPGSSSLVVRGDLRVGRGATLALGCEPLRAPCTDHRTGRGVDRVTGDLVARGALSVRVDASTIGGSVTQSGGGGSPTCGAPGTAQGRSSYTDDDIGRSLQLTDLRSCSVAVEGNRVHRNLIFSDNTSTDLRGSVVVSNLVGADLSCRGNSPAVQFGEETAGPNRVAGTATGQCSFHTYQPDPTPNGPRTPLSVHQR